MKQKLFQSTPPVKAATTQPCRGQRLLDISIHAAREGGDRRAACAQDQAGISIHAAREGGDARVFALRYGCGISIHAAREGGDETRVHMVHVNIISIHAAREGGDPYNVNPFRFDLTFQSTPPVKAATPRWSRDS